MRELLLRYAAIGAAGFAGAVSRVAVATAFGRLPWRFPAGTMVINVVGCLFLGWFLTYASTRSVPDTVRLAVGAGFVGAFTTFSTFMYESSRLADEGAGLEAIMNLLGSLMLGVLAIRAGMLVARWI